MLQGRFERLYLRLGLVEDLPSDDGCLCQVSLISEGYLRNL